MTEDGHGGADERHLANPWVAEITPIRIEKALKGFSLPLAEGWNYQQLTLEIQMISRPLEDDTPQSNRAAIKELLDLAAKAKALRGGIERLGDTAQTAALFDLWRRLEEEQDEVQFDTADFLRLIVEPLRLIEHTMARSASQQSLAPKQMPRWTERLAKDRRIGFAIALAPIFEEAFATPAHSANWRAEYGEVNEWHDFYKRLHFELYPEIRQLNLSEVVQAAARWRSLLQPQSTDHEAQDATCSPDNGE